VGLGVLLAAAGGCAGRAPRTAEPTEVANGRSPAGEAAPPAARPHEMPPDRGERSAAVLVAEAEDALVGGAPARAVALFSRALGAAADSEADGAVVGRAYLGLARAHERQGDCSGAIRAYAGYAAQLGPTDQSREVHMRRGACEAELERWERSALSYAAADALAQAEGALPSVRVEILARRGFALFQLEQFDEAVVALDEADAVYEAAMADDTERFDTYYFVGMARFYRAAVWHRRFRSLEIRPGQREMAADFERKLELLTQAQDAYNHTIRAKHVFWVSASGYQLGSLFEEFYDALMYAPVPEWLTDAQRVTYYEELKKQLRPVVNKAIWVFEKNLETARRLGYENPFIEKTEAQLARLQGVLLAGDSGLGQPHPRLAPLETRPDPGPVDPVTGELAVHAPGRADDATATAPDDPGSGVSPTAAPAVERKLFVPAKTPL